MATRFTVLNLSKNSLENLSSPASTLRIFLRMLGGYGLNVPELSILF